MDSPNGIKTILFDLDGTLRLNFPAGGEFFCEHAISLGLPVSTEDRLRSARWEHSYWAGSPELTADLGIYKEDSPEFWLNYSRRQLMSLGTGAQRAGELAPLIARHMNENYKPQSIAAPESLSAVTRLKEAGFRLGVVSNRERPFAGELEKIGMGPLFEFSLAGGEVQLYKPEPGIFEVALERIDSAAHEAAYVGDNYYADVVGARRAGLQPVLYDPDGIYPEADCPAIASFDDLSRVLESLK